jgi:hypothetical protein
MTKKLLIKALPLINASLVLAVSRPPANTTQLQGEQNQVNIRWSRLATKMPITRGTSGTGELENR